MNTARVGLPYTTPTALTEHLLVAVAGYSGPFQPSGSYVVTKAGQVKSSPLQTRACMQQ